MKFIWWNACRKHDLNDEWALVNLAKESQNSFVIQLYFIKTPLEYSIGLEPHAASSLYLPLLKKFLQIDLNVDYNVDRVLHDW